MCTKIKNPLEIYYLKHKPEINCSYEEFEKKWTETMSKSIFEDKKKIVK